MAITAADVKKLRDATGAGMMDSKKALEEADGDFDKAIEVLRVKGAAKAAKRGAERTASAGLVANAGGALVELNSETDFVAKSEGFIALADEIVAAAEQAKAADAEALKSVPLPSGKTVAEAIEAVAAVIGEKIELGRVAYFDGNATTYMHRRSSDLPPAVGVLVAFEGDNEEAARGAAMQIAAMRPQFVTRDEVPADLVDKERRSPRRPPARRASRSRRCRRSSRAASTASSRTSCCSSSLRSRTARRPSRPCSTTPASPSPASRVSRSDRADDGHV